MAGTNEMGSVEGQLVGLPLAGPETFSVQQLAYLKRALGVDETVLWSGSMTGDFSNGWTATLSELATNFEKIRICYAKTPGANSTADRGWGTMEFYTSDLAALGNIVTIFSAMRSGTNLFILFTQIDGWNTVNLTSNGGWQDRPNVASSLSASVRCYPFRIIGIHRIAGGN